MATDVRKVAKSAGKGAAERFEGRLLPNVAL